jgi:type IV secretion system protein TrbC
MIRSVQNHPITGFANVAASRGTGAQHSFVPKSPRPPFQRRVMVMLALIVLVAVGEAHAAGSGLPWEAPLERILESIEGPVAKVIAVLIIIVTGLSLAFGDMSGGFRRLIQIVFGLTIAFAATSFFLTFFSFAGGALIN